MADDTEPEFNPVTEKFYTTREMAEMFQVTEHTVRMWVTTKKLRCSKVNGRLFFTEQQIRDYANNRWGE